MPADRKKGSKRFTLKPVHIIPVSFLGAIALGTLLLMLPVSAADGKSTGVLTSLFTSTTSVCVTGLVVVDTFAHWSLFGKLVILTLIQLGGLGTVSFMSALMVILHRKFSIWDRNLLQDAFNLDTRTGLLKFLIKVFKGTFLIEGAGALLYFFKFAGPYGIVRGLWYSVFHSVSAFCNAGIDLLGADSLIRYNSDPYMLVVTMLLIILGGLGFVVWFDIIEAPSFRRLKEHSKLVLVLTAVLITGGAVIVFIAEHANPDTMGNMSTGDKVLNSIFQSVTFRTAGFASVPQEKLTPVTCIIGYVLMFIGGSPVGTAGGVKTVTMYIAIANATAFVRGRNETIVNKRKVSEDLIRKATAILMVSMFFVITMTALLIAAENIPMQDAAYEVVSALATVGLSRGLTGGLGTAGRIIIIVCMYLGRIGPISMALFFTKQKQTGNMIGYSEGRFYVG